MNTENSHKLFEEAKKYLVGGVNSPVRSFNDVGGEALVMKKGKGSQLFDHDGNSYTDYCLSWGALILGHAHRNVILGAKKLTERGMSFGTTTREEIDIAKIITQRVPSIEKIRFVNSGTEATMSAIRLARGFTQRDLLVKFDGCYHGHFDDLLTKAGSGVAQLKESSSLGITKNHIETTINLPYNDVDSLSKILTEHKDRIACVIIEPVAGNMGVIPAKKDFLVALRELTQKFSIVLIFDEIMTGFRTHPNCVQAQLDIIPDLTCLGKIIGGGFPIGAYGGREEIMQCLAPSGGVYQAGTFSGNPIVMKAGAEVLKLLNVDFYRSLNERCESFAQDLNQHFKAQQHDVHLSSFGSMMSLRFRKKQVLNYQDALDAADTVQYGKLFHALLQQEIYLPPADLESFFVSHMHTEKDLLHLAQALKEFFKS